MKYLTPSIASFLQTSVKRFIIEIVKIFSITDQLAPATISRVRELEAFSALYDCFQRLWQAYEKLHNVLLSFGFRKWQAVWTNVFPFYLSSYTFSINLYSNGTMTPHSHSLPIIPALSPSHFQCLRHIHGINRAIKVVYIAWPGGWWKMFHILKGIWHRPKSRSY